MSTKTKSPASLTKVITGKVRLSYAHVWTPVAIEDSDKAKYSVSLLIPKSDTKTVDKIKKAIKAALEQGKSSKFGGKVPKDPKLPLRDGDEKYEETGNEEYKDHYFVNASSITRPGIIDADRQKIIDEEEVYSGCYALASVNFYAFNVNGNKGIACGLNNLMKIDDGEPLGGRVSAEADFAEVDTEDDDDLF